MYIMKTWLRSYDGTRIEGGRTGKTTNRTNREETFILEHALDSGQALILRSRFIQQWLANMELIISAIQLDVVPSTIRIQFCVRKVPRVWNLSWDERKCPDERNKK